MDKKTNSGEKVVASNRRAFHDYSIERRFDAGLVLKGVEVKALRESRVQIREAYASVRDGEVWLYGMHISSYSSASTHESSEEDRPRKLLLRRSEIDELIVATGQKGFTVVPLRIYFHHGLAKIELGVGKGKGHRDRRHDIAAREARRDVDRAMRRAGR